MAEGRIAELSHLFENIEVDKIGVARLEPWKDTPMWHRVNKLLPGAKSIIVLAMEVFLEVVNYLTSKAQVGEMALRDLYDRNALLVDAHLDWQAYKVVKKLHNLGFKGLPLPAGGAPFDDRFLEGTLSYKHVAQAAGLGVLGWHSLLIIPEYGPRIRLACIVTDALLESSMSVEGEIPCPKCGGACIKICLVGAITEPQENEQYNVDKYACSTYYNASRSCSECLKVCPVGKRA